MVRSRLARSRRGALSKSRGDCIVICARWPRLLLIAVALGVGLVAPVAQAAPACEAPSGFTGASRLESADVAVLYRTLPAPIEVNQPFLVEAIVCPAPPIGQAAGFKVDARMPEHRHGMNYRAHVSRRPDGVYVAEGMLFHMPGLWQLMFDVERGGKTERLMKDIDLE